MNGISVHLIDRGRVHADTDYVFDGYSMGSASDPNPNHEMGEFVVQSAIVDGSDRTVLQDAGSNLAAVDGYWPDPLYRAFSHVDATDHTLEDDLGAVGYDPTDIDAVVMSHLHLDHAGGLVEFAGTGVSTHVHEEELKFACYSAKTTKGSIAYPVSDFGHGLSQHATRGDEHTLFDDFQLVHPPGRTPGVLSARIEAPDGDVLVAGDECYVEDNYTGEVPLGPDLLWSERDWFKSLWTVKELECRASGDVLLDRDLTRFESFGNGWNV